MSAYVLDTEKIERLASWMTSARAHSDYCYQLKRLGYGNKFDGPEEWERLAVDLLAMNQDAVMQRYPDCNATNLPGPVDPKQVGTRRPMPYSNGEVFGVLRSYLYQCSEGDVPQRDLYKAVESAFHTLCERMAEEYIKEHYPTLEQWA